MEAKVKRAESSGGVVAIGERLGFYKVMSEAPVTAAELARQTAIPVRFVRHWLAAQTEEGYVVHEPVSGRYANFCGLPRAA